MRLSDKQIDLIQESFARLGHIHDETAHYFYARLFEMAPEIRPMFRHDLAEQRQKLMATLGAIVRGLRDMPALLGAAGELARRHTGYGVMPEHYAPVGQALIDTLEVALDDDFTPETRAAWAAAYRALSGAMVATAYPQAA
jgi:hemoglobin-like flavoprotein